jgi:hypothetical protein
MVNGVLPVKTKIGNTGVKINGTGNEKFKNELERLRTEKQDLKNNAEKEPVQGKKMDIVKVTSTDNAKMGRENILKDVFRNLDEGHKRIESILKVSMSGVKLNQQELLTLQMRVYRFTQEVELISKLVEKGTSGVKQVVNTQI